MSGCFEGLYTYRTPFDWSPSIPSHPFHPLLACLPKLAIHCFWLCGRYNHGSPMVLEHACGLLAVGGWFILLRARMRGFLGKRGRGHGRSFGRVGCSVASGPRRSTTVHD
jgi:hypothetical protein